MGTIQHHTIIVTGEESRVAAARKRAQAAFRDTHARVSPVAVAMLNGTASFAVFPDASKEGWAESDDGDAARATFRDWLKEAGTVSWVEVAFGELGTEIVDTSEDDDG